MDVIRPKAVGIKPGESAAPAQRSKLLARHWPAEFHSSHLRTELPAYGKKIDIMFDGVSFCADVLERNGHPVKYVTGIVYHLQRTPDLRELVNYPVKVGIRMPIGLDIQHLWNLSSRLADERFVWRVIYSEEIAIVEIRELPVDAGGLEGAYKRALAEWPHTVPKIIGETTVKGKKISPYGIEVIFTAKNDD